MKAGLKWLCTNVLSWNTPHPFISGMLLGIVFYWLITVSAGIISNIVRLLAGA